MAIIWQNLYFDVAVNYFSAVQVLEGLQSLVKVFKRLHLREPGTLILVIEEAAFLNELHDHVQPVVFDDAIPKLHDVRMVQFHVNLNLVLDDFQFGLIFNFFQVQLCQRACYNFNRVELAGFYVSSQSDHTERTIAQYFILKDMEFSNGMKITFLLKFYHLKNHILSPQLMTFTSRLSEISEQIIRLLCTRLMISRIHRGVNQKIQENIFKKLPVLFLPCPLRSHVGTARIKNNSAQLKLKEFSMASQKCRVIMDYNFLYNQDARQFFIPKYKLMASRGQEQCNKWGYQSTGQDPSEPKIQIKFMPNSYKNKLLMTIESEIQFEDFSHFESAYFRQTKSPEEIELELNLILGIAPLPLSMEQDPFECKMSLTQIIRKNSVNTVSQDTHPSQFDQESRDTNQSDHNTKTSNHHNFQKHTVTALKDMVKQEKFQIFCPNHQTLKLVTRLWRQFLKIKGRSIMTKKFLSALFRSDMKSVELLKSYGFKQMFQDFSESDILKAKIELRRLVVVFLNNQNIEDHVERRQIKRKEQFRLYLINFRQDLESANIKKRISKESSDWIADNAKIFDCLN